jgi:hypothetical protein
MGKLWLIGLAFCFPVLLFGQTTQSDSHTSVISPSLSDRQAGEDSLARYFQFDDPSPLSCLITLLPPFFIQHDLELKAFVRSKTFRRIRRRYGDLRAADAVFVRAMQLTDNNTAIALLLSSVASFDHQLIELKVPVLALFFPLSNESDQEFDRRISNLPTKLYPDGPPSGDRDKLQHFFGSAFIAFVFESAPSADRVGEFVEQEEDQWIVGGANDDRDRRTNRQGQQFGLALLDNNRQYPSTFMQLHLASEHSERHGAKRHKRTSFNDAHCEGIW